MSDSIAHSPPTLTICATARLARAFQQHQQQLFSQSNTQWQTPRVLTLQQFLADFMQQAMLAGEILPEQTPLFSLSAVAEKMLWQQVIQQALAKHDLAALFDVASLADSAMEANQLLLEWQVADETLDSYFQTTETRQFLRWRRGFMQLCAQHKTLESSRLLALQIVCITKTRLRLPAKMVLLGFDRITPLEQHLFDALSARGVTITLAQPNFKTAHAQQMVFENLDAECRAATAWAQQTLSQNPQANLAIITPILGNIRAKLADLLDDTFHVDTLHPSQYEAPRVYDFSLGLPLSEHNLIASALNLIRLQANIHKPSQAHISEILLSNYWGNLHELDARSLLDAQMRKQLSRNISLNHFKKLTEKQNNVDTFLAHLNHLQTTQKDWGKKQKPSIWVAQFSQLLGQLNWANTRSLSSHEFQAQQRWLETLQQFSELDNLLYAISATDAVNKLTQMCQAKMFQPETIGAPRIQILGMLESSAIPLDAAWILGMNDQHWPPPAKPNPLLPIKLQRDFKIPNADTDIQAAFAQKVHARIMLGAKNCVFSWSRKDADRELRPSPLLADMHICEAIAPIATLAEILAKPTKMQLLDDHTAPPILPEDKLRGGSKLFETQAICPAWTFYQYRLGATALQTPVDGLDSMARGNLLHAVLQHFWLACKDSKTLKSYSKNQLKDALQASIHAGCRQANLSEFAPKQVIEIEKQRLQALLETWLALEKQRADFSVEQCEADFLLTIEGLEIKLRVDRIDSLEGALADGGLIVIDYKTGATQASHSNWADARITAPQLPLYASLALKDQQVVAACFAKVNVFECKFSGLTQDAILPDVKPFDNLASNSKFKTFENWQSLLAHWQKSLTDIALEIKSGAAGVVFEREADLLYCEVKPLLRLPERELQFEQQHAE